MGDRTFGTMTVTACPPEHLETVLAVLNDYGLVPPDKTFDLNWSVDELVLGETYTYDQVSCGWSGEADSTLCDLDGLAYMISEDPKYEWLGGVYYRLADGRGHNADADAGQNIVLTAPGWARLRSGFFGGKHHQPGSSASLAALVGAVDVHFGWGLVEEWQGERDRLLELPIEERTLSLPEEAE